MSEQNPEPYQTPYVSPEAVAAMEAQPGYHGGDTQPEDGATVGGELNHTEELAPIGDSIDVNAINADNIGGEAVEVSVDSVASADTKRDNVHGNDYEVTADRGYRKL